MSENEKKIAALLKNISELEALMSTVPCKKMPDSGTPIVQSGQQVFTLQYAIQLECLKKISSLQKDILKLK